jgi:hypothetical protein
MWSVDVAWAFKSLLRKKSAWEETLKAWALFRLTGAESESGVTATPW